MPLLPPNATELERALEEVITEMLTGVDIPVRTLRTVATCPLEWLPWLAWERAVDTWNDGWPEELKRSLIAQAYQVHSLKGTVAADRRILEAAGAVYDYAEGSGADHHTVTINVQNSGSILTTVGELEAAINRVRRASVHYTVTATAGFCTDPAGGAAGRTAAVALFEPPQRGSM